MRIQSFFEKLVESDSEKNSIPKNITKSIIFRKCKICFMKNNVFSFMRHN